MTRVNISLPEDLANEARKMSIKTGIPLSQAIQRLLRYWIKTGKIPIKNNEDL